MTNQAKIVITAEDKASAVLRDLRGGVDRASDAFARLSGAIGVLGGGALLASLTGLVSRLDDLKDAAQGLGVSASDLDKFRNAAAAGGVDAAGLDTALTKLNVKIAESGDEASASARLFRLLGVETRDLDGKTRATGDVLRDVADRFASYRDGAEKSALAVELFGKSGAKLIPVLNEGAAGLVKFGGASEGAIDEAAKLQGEIDKLTAAFGRLAKSTAGGAASLINRALGLSTFDTAAVDERVRRVTETISGLERELAGIPAADIGTRRKFLEAELRRLRAVLEGIRDETAEKEKQAPGRAPDLPVQAAVERATGKAKELKSLLDEIDRGASQRDLARLQRIDDAQRQADDAAAERARRLSDLTGQSAIRQQAEDLRLIEEALFDGAISLDQFDVAYKRVFGLESEASRGLQQAKDGFEQLALVFTSSIGKAIESGRLDLESFFDALLKDLLKLTTQLLIVKPLSEGLAKVLSGGGGGGAGDLLSNIGSGIAGFLGFGGARAAGGPVDRGRAYLVGEQGPELFVPRSAGGIVPNGAGVTNNITVNLPQGSNVTRETGEQIAAAVARKLAQASRRYN
jgi:hypothetical protein